MDFEEGQGVCMVSHERIGKGHRVIACILVVALLGGIIVTDRTDFGRKNAHLSGNAAYAYLAESMECLSFGWMRWLVYWLGTQLSNEMDASGQYRRACVAIANEDFTEAATWMELSAGNTQQQTDEEKATLSMQLACVRSLAGDADGAMKATKEAVQHRSEDDQLLKLLYQFSLDAGDAQSAAEALMQYAELTDDTGYYEEIADLYFEAGMHEDSGRFYELAMKENGKTDKMLYRRATANMLLGHYDKAITDFAESETPGSRYAQGVCAMALDDLKQAVVCFEESIKRGEQVNDARLMLAACRIENAEYTEAEELLDQYIAAGGAYEDVAYYRAGVRAMLGDYAGAAQDYEASANAGLFREESMFAAAQCRYNAGDYERAIEQLEQCLEEEIEPAQSWYYLGLAFMAVGENERAAQALNKALEFGK